MRNSNEMILNSAYPVAKMNAAQEKNSDSVNIAPTIIRQVTNENKRTIQDIQTILIQSAKRDSILQVYQKKIKQKPVSKPQLNTDSLLKHDPEHRSVLYNLKNESLPLKNNISLSTFPFKNHDSLYFNPALQVFYNDSSRNDAAVHQYLQYISKSQINNSNKTNRLFSNDWFLIISLLAFFIMIWSRVFYRKYLSRIFSGFFSYHASNILFNNKSVLLNKSIQLLKFNFSINLSLFITLTVKYFFEMEGNDPLFLFIAMCFIVPILYFIKRLSNRIAGLLFNVSDITSEYIHNYELINIILGIALFPLIIFMMYIKQVDIKYFVYSGMVIIGIAFFIRFMRALQIIFRKGVSFFYMILYLCTLEILPFLWLYKLIEISV